MRRSRAVWIKKLCKKVLVLQTIIIIIIIEFVVGWLVVLTVVFRFQIQAISAYCLLICIPFGISDGFSSLILKIIFHIYSNYYLYNNYLLFDSHLLNLIPAGATLSYSRRKIINTDEDIIIGRSKLL